MKARYVFSGGFLENFWDELEIRAELQDRFMGVWWDRDADFVSVNCPQISGLYHSVSNHNIAFATLHRSDNQSLGQYLFNKDIAAHFDVTAYCTENGGQYVGEVTVSR